MTRISGKGQDAFATGYHHRYSESVSYAFISKLNGYLIMNHLYYYRPKSPASFIIVRAYDAYGNVYTTTTSRVGPSRSSTMPTIIRCSNRRISRRRLRR
jgi:hypothetical protein